MWGIWVLVITFLTGCAAGPKFVAKDVSFPDRVAVLPFSNETNDVEGPETVRKVLIEMLSLKGYIPLPKEQVDETLMKELGITEGGQLGSTTAQELGKYLGVDALFYGNLLSFIDLPLGFVRKRTVKANFRLVDVQTGNLLWEDERSWTTPEIYLSVDEAKWAAARQVAERQYEKMTGTFLKDESQIVVLSALESLPLPAGAGPESESRFKQKQSILKSEIQMKIRGRIRLR